MQAERVKAVSPLVRKPAVQLVQFVAPGAENRLSAPHLDGMLAPSHLYPAAHGEQDVRVTFVPPDVTDPRGHRVQLLAPLEVLNMSSAPQTVHVVLEASL